MIELVSIIVPCYNQAQFLPEALQSVMVQTYENWECIIINDGSTDNTAEVIQEWLAKDNRFKYIKIKNEGVSNARNAGIQCAKGNFIMPLDADDKIASNYIELAINKFQEDKELTLVYSNAKKFGEVSENWILKNFSLRTLASENMIFCTAIYKKEDWLRIGGYDINMKKGLEDWEFWIALLKNGEKVFRLNEICFFYRIKNNSRNTGFNLLEKNELLNYINIKHVDFVVAQLGSSILLTKELREKELEFKDKLQSEKFVFKLFCNTFFRFSMFNKK